MFYSGTSYILKFYQCSSQLSQILMSFFFKT